VPVTLESDPDPDPIFWAGERPAPPVTTALADAAVRDEAVAAKEPVEEALADAEEEVTFVQERS